MSGVTLIVDDSLTVRADLAEAFELAGLPTVACATVAQARAALAGQSFGLIVLDVVLPDGDGVDLLREIRTTAQGANMPVLMLSSEADVRDRIRGLMTGSNDYVGKPYDPEYVITRARQLLGQGRAGAPAARTAGSRPRVLIIDDSETFRERLGELLSLRGFDVLRAASGEEGLRSASTNRPDAVVVDGVLPGIDGSTVVRKLRLDAALHHTPCILLTGSQDLGAELRALESGADAFVRKEEDLEVILARISAVLRHISTAGEEPHSPSLLAPKKIMAVDDSATYLHELGETLRGEGFDVILARCGQEALDMLAVQSVDCILLDRLMPGLSGTETCRRIKSSPELRDIPLIMLTAMEDREAMIEGLSTGADDYVLKSSELDVLKARLRAQLRRKQFEDESRRVRGELMQKELEAAQARAARELFESRAELLLALEQKNRQLETANRLKSEFLSHMSHELRTPLNAIIGFSSVLEDGLAGELNPQQSEFTHIIADSGKHLLSLINDILDLSKIEAGMMNLELESCDIQALLESSLGVVRERALSHQLRWRLEAEPIGWVMADQRKTRQIVYNLLSNAVKFTPDQGAVTLRLHTAASADLPADLQSDERAQCGDEVQRYMVISVADTGIGIGHDDMQRLFQPFVQLDSGLSRRYEGTGLGLALTKQLVHLLGGRLGARSELGVGSTFSVWLPCLIAPPPAADSPAAPRPGGNKEPSDGQRAGS